MPAVKMTNVWPTAMTRNQDAFCAISEKAVSVRNLPGAWIVNQTHSTTSARKVQVTWPRSNRSSWPR
jgi:hypothetical protein